VGKLDDGHGSNPRVSCCAGGRRRSAS
jgi:hypothetical protein